MAEWGYWVIGIAAFLLLLDIHKRVSVAMDAVLRMEERMNAQPRDQWHDRP